MGQSLLRYQKRFAGLVAGKRGRYHADPLFAQFAMLEVGDLYRQQLRVHAWRFWHGQLPVNQAAMLSRVGEVHGHATRSAGVGIHVAMRDHAYLGYRAPREWVTLMGEQRGAGSMAAFKRRSRVRFLGVHGAFECGIRGCGVSGAGVV